MSITISTSDYTQDKAAVIDGVDFKVRPMNSSVGITIANLGQELQNAGKDTARISEIIEEMENLFFSLFDKPKEAKKLLSGLPMDSLWKIYDKIMKGNEQNG